MTSGENEPPAGSEATEGPPSGYGQPPGSFGQYQYGQPMYGAVAPAGYAQPRAGRGVGVGVVGIVLAVAGGVAGVIAFTSLDWFKGPRPSHFSDVHDWVHVAHGLHIDPAVSYMYFNWLGWVLLAAAVVLALLANLPSPASAGLRVCGAFVGLAGMVLTFWAIDYAHHAAYSEFLKSARLGFYVTLGAFLLTFIASLIGPRRIS